MYVDPPLITPYALAWLGVFGIGVGLLLMIEAGRASARGASLTRVEREGRLGARMCLGGFVLLVVSGAWSILK